MPTDATEPTSDEAIHFAEFIKDRLKIRQDHAGLFVLLDACHAGAGAWQSMERWAQSLQGNFSFELLTATDDRATANAPLARAVIELLERGDPEAGERLHGRDVHRLLKERNRPAQHVAYNADDARLCPRAEPRARPRRRLLEGQPGTRPDPEADRVFPAHAPARRTGRGHPVAPGGRADGRGRRGQVDPGGGAGPARDRRRRASRTGSCTPSRSSA